MGVLGSHSQEVSLAKVKDWDYICSRVFLGTARHALLSALECSCQIQVSLCLNIAFSVRVRYREIT